MNIMIIMVRCGVLNSERKQEIIASFDVGSTQYRLVSVQSLLNESQMNFYIQTVIEDVVVRNARVGMITSTTRGITFEFIASVYMIQWFLNLKNLYISGGDDWFLIATSVGELYYTTDMQSLEANAFEAEQRRQLMKVQSDFTVKFDGLDLLSDDLHVELDDIWDIWENDDENPLGDSD